MDGSPFRLGALPIPIPGKSEEELSINNGIEINTGHIEVPISSPHADFLPSSVDSGICVATGTSEVDKTDGTTNSFEGDENYPIKDFVNHAGLSPKIHVQPFHKILGMTCDVYTADDYEMVTKKFQRCPPDRVYILHDIQNKWKLDHQKIGILFCNYEADMILFVSHCQYDDLEESMIRKAKYVKHIAF